MSLLDLSSEQAAESAQRSTLRAFVAPLASDAGAVIDDMADLEIAYAILDAFDAADGLPLGRAELADACTGICAPALFESRFEVYVKLGMLIQKRSKAHQQRYTLSPNAVAGLAVVDRVSREGGVQDLLLMLDATTEALRNNEATRQQVATALGKGRASFFVFAQHLTALVETATFADLIAQRRHHRNARAIDNAKHLVDAVIDKYPDLHGPATRLVDSVGRYQHAVTLYWDRIAQEGHAHRDFTMLDPDQYLNAALHSTKAALAAPFAAVLFDPPHPLITAETVVEAVDHAKPRQARRRPPEPGDSEPADRVNPVIAAAEREAKDKRMVELAMEQHLNGEQQVDLTSRLRAAGWPAAGRMVAEVLAMRDQPYEAIVSDALIVDPGGPVTHISPITLTRVTVAGAPFEPDVYGLAVQAVLS
jgi:hypothetical protein